MIIRQKNTPAAKLDDHSTRLELFDDFFAVLPQEGYLIVVYVVFRPCVDLLEELVAFLVPEQHLWQKFLAMFVSLEAGIQLIADGGSEGRIGLVLADI